MYMGACVLAIDTHTHTHIYIYIYIRLGTVLRSDHKIEPGHLGVSERASN